VDPAIHGICTPPAKRIEKVRAKTLVVLLALMLLRAFPAVSKQPDLSKKAGSQSSKAVMMPGAASAHDRALPRAGTQETNASAATLEDQISVRASGRGKPWINLGDGHELVSSYSGASELIDLMENNTAQPISLTTGNLDGDGVPDLVSGFSSPNGGVVAISLGNPDAIYPNSPEALARKKNGTFTGVPFLSPVRLFETASRPDFIETGDFNADGFVDVAIAQRGDNRLFVLPGDGNGRFKPALKVDLPGRVTAMSSGDVNRRDGLADLLVGVTTKTGARLLVFESPDGALKSTPEEISLPAAAAAIASGYLYNNTYADIAVVAGPYLVAVQGRDRELSSSVAVRGDVPAARITGYALGAAGRSIAIGRFEGDGTTQAAVLTSSGVIELFGAGSTAPGLLQVLEKSRIIEESNGFQARLAAARVSGRKGEDLIVTDPAAGRLRLMLGAKGDVSIDKSAIILDDQPVDLTTDAAPVAVLPMRLNVSARNDLVVLRSGHVNASLVPAQFDNTFTVTTITDDDPNVPMVAGVEPSQGGHTMTFRDTITDAINAPQGTSNLVVFEINQSGVPIIQLQGVLPSLPTGSTLTIDGTTQAQVGGSALVEVQGVGNDVLVAPGTSAVIRGLVINGSQAPIQVVSGTSNIIEGNFFGTAPDGITRQPNSSSNIIVSGGSGNMIGGTASAATNVIGASLVDGITLENNATGTMIMGNFVGIDKSLQTSLSNSGNGVQIETGATATTLGSTTAANFFDFNGLDGISISSGTNHLAINNASQGNSGSGTTIGGATSSTIGGAQGANLGNGFWSNSQNGLVIESGATGITAQGNGIGVAFSDGNPQQFPNTLDGISISASSNLIGGTAASLGNAIAFNGGDGVAVVSGSGDAILSNVIAANSPALPIRLSLGANNNEQPPTISGVVVAQGGALPSGLAIKSATVTPSASGPIMVISFAFQSTPNQTFDMQFFVPQICNCTNCFTNVGIYSTQVTTDGSGNAPSPISIALTSEPASGSFVNATATDAADDTSEFSECVEVGTSTACTYSLSAESQEISSGGGSGSFTVSTTATCPVAPEDSDSWVHITSAAEIGSGTVSFTVDPNSGTSARSSTITVATGVNFTVNEDGTGPSFSIALSSNTVSGSPGSVIPVTVSISRGGGFTSPVTITPPAKADGIKIKPASAKKLKGSNTSFTVNVKITASATPGTFHFTFTGAGTGLTGTQTAVLNVTVQ